MSPRALSLSLALLALGSSGCAGASANVVADGARVPVSLSRAVRGADGQLIPQKRLVKVARFRHSTKAWSLLYTTIPIAQHKDLAEPINRQVAAAGGHAVVNLEVAASDCVSNWMIPFTWLPVWPGCTSVTVEGDIVQELATAQENRETLAATQPLGSWLHEHCAFVGAVEHEGVAGAVPHHEGTFLCAQTPPHTTAPFTPAEVASVLCLDTAAEAICVPPSDPELAARHDAERTAQQEAERRAVERAEAEARAASRKKPARKPRRIANR